LGFDLRPASEIAVTIGAKSIVIGIGIIGLGSGANQKLKGAARSGSGANQKLKGTYKLDIVYSFIRLI
jgi:hypothetical protein